MGRNCQLPTAIAHVGLVGCWRLDMQSRACKMLDFSVPIDPPVHGTLPSLTLKSSSLPFPLYSKVSSPHRKNQTTGAGAASAIAAASGTRWLTDLHAPREGRRAWGGAFTKAFPTTSVRRHAKGGELERQEKKSTKMQRFMREKREIEYVRASEMAFLASGAS